MKTKVHKDRNAPSELIFNLHIVAPQQEGRK